MRRVWLGGICYRGRMMKNAVKILGIEMIAGLAVGLLVGTTLPII